MLLPNYTDHTHLANFQPCVIVITRPLHAWTRAAACSWSKSLFRVHLHYKFMIINFKIVFSTIHSLTLLSYFLELSLRSEPSSPPSLLSHSWSLTLSAAKRENVTLFSSILSYVLSHRARLLLFLKSMASRSHPGHPFIPHTPYLIYHQILCLLPPK